MWLRHVVEWCGKFVKIWYPRFCQCFCAEAILFNQCNMQCSFFFKKQSEDTFLCHCIPGLSAGDDVSEMAWTCHGAQVNRIVCRLWAGALGKVQRFAARMHQFAQVTWREDGSWCLQGYKIPNTRMRAVRYITDWHDFEKNDWQWLLHCSRIKNYRAEKSSQGKIRKDVILY